MRRSAILGGHAMLLGGAGDGSSVFHNSWGVDWHDHRVNQYPPRCVGCSRWIWSWQEFRHGHCNPRPDSAGYVREGHYVGDRGIEVLKEEDRVRREQWRGAQVNLQLADGFVHAGYGDLASMRRVGPGHFRPARYRLHCKNGVFDGVETPQAPTCLECVVQLG